MALVVLAEENKVYQEVILRKTLFRAYDIRGVIDETFNENAYYTIGRAISVYLARLNKTEILLARDARLSSNQLAEALKQGLIDSGITVVDLGEVSTPIIYFATFTSPINSGLMVTGSHNPANYNGIKIVIDGKTFVQNDINQLFELVQAQTFINHSGKHLVDNYIPRYKERIIDGITLARKLKVVVDAGNGVAGPIIVDVLQRLGCDVIPLYCEVDGSFPNHHPDPSVEANLKDLKTVVLEQRADIGLAFDGDADRLGVITNTGQVVWPDTLLMFYAEALLKKRPGVTIVYDVKCTNNLAKQITRAGGVAKMCPTGHSIVKAEMKNCNAALAGEMSGHIFFNDRWYGFDDALYSACRLLEIISISDDTVQQQFSVFPQLCNTPEINIAISDDTKFKFMEQFKQTAAFPNAIINHLDGVRVEYDYGWGLVRASNTSPCLVTRFEATTIEQLQQLQSCFKQQLLAINNQLVIPF